MEWIVLLLDDANGARCTLARLAIDVEASVGGNDGGESNGGRGDLDEAREVLTLEARKAGIGEFVPQLRRRADSFNAGLGSLGLLAALIVTSGLLVK